jgi:hypothetical protein
MNDPEDSVPMLTIDKFYEEANNSRRYYLSLAVNTRNIAIVQGVAVLGAPSHFAHTRTAEMRQS